MHRQILFTVLVLAVSTKASGLTGSSAWKETTTSSIITCNLIKQNVPNITYLPDDVGYMAENEVSWDARAWLEPACIITPASAEQLSYTVNELRKLGTPFAMRGGGHMPIANAANIDSSGVLISSTRLNTIELSDDLQTMSIGSGNRWGDVYKYLNATQTGKMVVGGRYGPVGVPGLLLGGGMSFFSWEYGFASTNGNVRSFECVLANGTIVEATASNEHSDLYWALQGGGNSFCLLTKFDLRTFDSPSIMLAEATYGSGSEIKKQWLNSMLNYVQGASNDVKAAIEAVARFGTGYASPIYTSSLFYNGNVSTPKIFSDFQGGLLPSSSSTNLTAMSMATFAELVTPSFQKGGESYGLRQRFHVVSIQTTLEAMTIVHDTFFEAAYKLLNLTDFVAGLAFNAPSTKFIEASNSGIGCPQGIEPIPVFWIEQALTWNNPADDAIIEEFVQTVNANVTAQLTAINATAKYIYLNDADSDQSVFQGYPAKNVQRLKNIRDRYDPAMIYTNQMPGGFKVAHAKA